MSSAAQSSIVVSLAEADELAGRYEWNRAAEVYKQALESPGLEDDPAENARIRELLARSYFKASFQSQTRQEFKETMHRAEDAYRALEQVYEKTGSSAASKRSDGRALFAQYWQIEDPAERKELVQKSLLLAEDVAAIYEAQTDNKALAHVHGEILWYLSELFFFSSDWTSLRETYHKARIIGEKAGREFEELGDPESQLECLNLASLFGYSADLALKPSETSEMQRESKQLTIQIRKASASCKTPYATFLANESLGILETDHSKGLEFFNNALSASEIFRDKLLAGRALTFASEAARFASVREDDVARKNWFFEKDLEFSGRAIALLEVPFSGYLLEWANWEHAETYGWIAKDFDNAVEQKKEDLTRAISWAEKTMAYKDHLSFPGGSASKSKTMLFLATIIEDRAEKKRILEEAISIAEKHQRQIASIIPLSWNCGVGYNYLALMRAEAATVADDQHTKAALLQAAILDMEKCLKLCASWALSPDGMTVVARYCEWFGDILNQFHLLEGDRDVAKRSISAYQEAIAYVTKAEYAGPIPQLRWKIARIQNSLADYGAAETSFKQAANEYRFAATKSSSLKQVFDELSSYMEAWSLIDKARVHHAEEQYSLASESYNQAATTLQLTRHWSGLSKHYQGCALIEKAEAFSRQENPQAAAQSFTSAIEDFREGKKDLVGSRNENRGIPDGEEMQDWVRITDGRIRYCQGRLELEEAALLDRRGDRSASAVRFHSASQIFKGLMTDAESKRTRAELEALVYFSEAWARLKEAEEKSSPELYALASESFLKAHEVSEKRFRALALASSSICKAFQSGTTFRRTRDPQLYSGIKRELETAGDYYQEGGFENAAHWTQATQRLFDALLYLSDAETERDPRKKTELYHFAEKHLELASKLYDEAGFSSKRDEARRHLDRVRQEKKILLTPVEALAENPAIVATPTVPVSLIRDQAAGLERFETANIVGNLTLPQREVGVGSDLIVELEMANVGKTAAMLMKLEDVAPEGLEIDRERVPQRLEDNYLDMKGKRLEYLKTHEVKIPIRAKRKGTFQVRPRILFVDEKGAYRSYEFEPASITVRELGISGWVRGPK